MLRVQMLPSAAAALLLDVRGGVYREWASGESAAMERTEPTENGGVSRGLSEWAPSECEGRGGPPTSSAAPPIFGSAMGTVACYGAFPGLAFP